MMPMVSSEPLVSSNDLGLVQAETKGASSEQTILTAARVMSVIYPVSVLP